MGRTDKPGVTDNCSATPTESVNKARFSYTGETCAVTQETTSEHTQTLISPLKLAAGGVAQFHATFGPNKMYRWDRYYFFKI